MIGGCTSRCDRCPPTPGRISRRGSANPGARSCPAARARATGSRARRPPGEPSNRTNTRCTRWPCRGGLALSAMPTDARTCRLCQARRDDPAVRWGCHRRNPGLTYPVAPAGLTVRWSRPPRCRTRWRMRRACRARTRPPPAARGQLCPRLFRLGRPRSGRRTTR